MSSSFFKKKEKQSVNRPHVLKITLFLSIVIHFLLFCCVHFSVSQKQKFSEEKVVLLTPVHETKENSKKQNRKVTTKYSSNKEHIADKETSVPLNRQNLSSGIKQINQGSQQVIRHKSQTIRVLKPKHIRSKSKQPNKKAHKNNKIRRVLMPEEEQEDLDIQGKLKPISNSKENLKQELQEAVKENLFKKGTGEYIPEVNTGRFTDVSTKKSGFSNYFAGLKKRLAKNWHPDVVYKNHDPDASIYGPNTWKTVLEIEIDTHGNLIDTRVYQPSGLIFLDDEAIRAFKVSAPFLPPPKEILNPKTGTLKFRFGFILRVYKSKTVFEYFIP